MCYSFFEVIAIARPKEFDRDIALQKAMQVFWTKGYEGTSVDDLIAAMDISKSSLYQSFGSKQDLFLETIELYLEFTDRKRCSALAQAASAKEGMAAFFEGVLRFVLEPTNPGGCFYTNTATALGTLDQRIHEVIRRGSAKMESDFYQFLLQGQEKGELAPEKDVQALAQYFVSLTRGVSVMARINADRETLAAIVKTGLSVLD